MVISSLPQGILQRINLHRADVVALIYQLVYMNLLLLMVIGLIADSNEKTV